MLFRSQAIALLVFVLCINFISVYASGDAIETARDNCNQVESPLDVPVACEVHIHCLFNTASINCTEPTLVSLTGSCRNMPIDLCADIATLTTVAIEDAILGFQSMDSTTQLNNSLSAFVTGDYQTALDLYENVTLSLDYFPHYLLELGLGVIYLRFDNPDVALIQFDKSINLEFYNPVAFYYRGNTYVQRGNDVRALRDHYLYDLLADTNLKVTLPLRSFRIQIADSRLWDLYPIYTLEQHSDSFALRDDTLIEVQSVVISFLDNDETLVIADWLDIVAGDETEILFLERDPQNPLRYILNVNQQDIPNSAPSGKTEISVIVSPVLLEFYIRSTQNAETVLVTSIANELDEPDIRQENTERICDLLPFSLLDLDTEILPLPPQTELYLVDDPVMDDRLTVDLSSSDQTIKNFKVIDGAVCYDNHIWWQVSNGTLTGWIAENADFPAEHYAVLPIDLLAEWQTSPPSPLQFLRLAVPPDDE